MADTWSVEDGWSSLLLDVERKLSDAEQRAAMAALGAKMVARVKLFMVRQLGFGNGKRYRKLKIKFRYHGRKQLHRGPVGADGKRTAVSVTNRTRVTPQSLALFDLGDLFRSWSVKRARATSVHITPRSRREKSKARYNDDRGAWYWGDDASDAALAAWLEPIDRGLFR